MKTRVHDRLYPALVVFRPRIEVTFFKIDLSIAPFLKIMVIARDFIMLTWVDEPPYSNPIQIYPSLDLLRHGLRVLGFWMLGNNNPFNLQTGFLCLLYNPCTKIFPEFQRCAEEQMLLNGIQKLNPAFIRSSKLLWSYYMCNKFFFKWFLVTVSFIFLYLCH